MRLMEALRQKPWQQQEGEVGASVLLGRHVKNCLMVSGLHTLPVYRGMVVGSKAEEELWSMTREEVETELLKIPAHRRFREFNTHLAKTAAEWAALDKQLLKLET
jgi:hypothetical protein